MKKKRLGFTLIEMAIVLFRQIARNNLNEFNDVN